eukprot:COSAG05_NODE_7734_length_774_cov_8.882963_1_plen_205_part_10
MLSQCVDTLAQIVTRGSRSMLAPDLLRIWHAREAQMAVSEQALLDNCITMMDALPAASSERAAIAAVVCQSTDKSTRSAATGIKAVRSTKVGKALFASVVKDKKMPEVAATTRATVKPEVTRQAVEFITHTDNVVTVSWGKKWVRQRKRRVQIPCLSRKKSKESMWQNYVAAYPNKGTRVSRASFYRLAKALTGPQQKSFKAVDY